MFNPSKGNGITPSVLCLNSPECHTTRTTGATDSAPAAPVVFHDPIKRYCLPLLATHAHPVVHKVMPFHRYIFFPTLALSPLTWRNTTFNSIYSVLSSLSHTHSHTPLHIHSSQSPKLQTFLNPYCIISIKQHSLFKQDPFPYFCHLFYQ